VVFTDADCEPIEGWLAALLAPFEDPTVVGTKGAYLTRQRALTARFTQLEYRHPERPGVYLPRKYRYAHWRAKAVGKTPSKAVSDGHSPLANKAQVVLMGPLVALRAAGAPVARPLLGVIAAHAVLSIPFVAKALRRDPSVRGGAAPASGAQCAFQAAGIATGSLSELQTTPRARRQTQTA
jgi:hypothetical protein